MVPYGDWVNIGLNTGLLPCGTKPLTEPILTYQSMGFPDMHLSVIPQKMFYNSICEKNKIITLIGHYHIS